MHARFVCGDLACVHELLDIGMVAGYADEGALMQQVCARVAHVGDGDGVAFDIGAGCSAAHARFSQAVRCGFDDGSVGGFDRCGEERRIGGVRGGLGDGFHGKRRRNLAGGVPAHAVADAEKRRLNQVGVLVVRTHAAYVRAGAPHERRGGAGVVGRIGVDALFGDR